LNLNATGQSIDQTAAQAAGGRAAEPGTTREPLRSGPRCNSARRIGRRSERRSVRPREWFPRPHIRPARAVDTSPMSSYREFRQRSRSRLDRTASILRPWGASLAGALVLLCVALPADVAVAASGTPLLQPDLPPTGAVVAPAPDAPAAEAPQPAVGHGQPVVRPTLRVASHVSVAPPVATTRPKAAAARTHVAKASRRASKHEPRAHASIQTRARLPDSVTPSSPPRSLRPGREDADGIDRRRARARGVLLAVVTLGGGCLTLAVLRVAQER
jgi:hypothetical protein